MPIIAPNVLNSLKLRRKLLLTREPSDSTVIDADVGIHDVYVPSDLGGRLRIGLFPKKDHVDHELYVHLPGGGFARRDAAQGEVRVDFAAGSRGDGKCVVSVIAPTGKYRLYALFEETGFARGDHELPLVPWNFWYYPFSMSDPDKTAWASSKVDPLGQYERAFGVSGAKAWEEEHHADAEGRQPEWAGHCHNAAPASVLFERPPAAGVEHDGVTISCEELKYLATEFFGRFGQVFLTWHLPKHKNLGRAGAKRELKPSQARRSFGRADVLTAFLDTLRVKIRNDGHALAMDLRDARGVDPDAIWTHAVYGYHTKYWQPEASDLRLVEGETLLFANQDMWEDGDDSGMPATLTSTDDRQIVPAQTRTGREQILRFRLRFRKDGSVDSDARSNLWKRVVIVPNEVFKTAADTFAPSFAHVLGKPWPVPPPHADGNPRIEREHVLELLRLRKRFR